MSPSRTSALIENPDWPEIVNRLLGGTDSEQREARDLLWVQVRHFVVDRVHLVEVLRQPADLEHAHAKSLWQATRWPGATSRSAGRSVVWRR